MGGYTVTVWIRSMGGSCMGGLRIVVYFSIGTHGGLETYWLMGGTCTNYLIGRAVYLIVFALCSVGSLAQRWGVLASLASDQKISFREKVR